MPSPTKATDPKRLPAHPERDLDVEQLLNERNVEWHFEADKPLDWFDHEKSLRNQARIQTLIDEVVARYKQMWVQGRRPKAVVSMDDGQRLDGNHRAASLMMALPEIREEIPGYQPTLSTYIIDKAPPEIVELLKIELNNLHGQPPSDAERVLHAVRLSRMPRTRLKEIAVAVGLPEYRVRNEVARDKADERARELELVGFQELPGQTRGRLGNVNTDAAFIAAVDLVKAARLPLPEVNHLVTAINSTRSEKGQLEVVSRARKEHGPRLQATGGGFTHITVAASPTKLYDLLNRILQVDIDGLLQIVARPSDREHLVDRIEEAADKLETLVKELRGEK